MAERTPRNMTDYEAEYAAFQWDRPERFNFAIDVVDRWATERPDAPALLHCDDRGNRKVYSWRELAERSVHAALFLRDLGLRAGDGVFTMLPRLAEWWILALGCMRANLVLMPGTTMLTGKDVRYRLELGRARAVVTTAEHLPKFEVGAHADVIAWISTDEVPAPWVRFRTQTVDGARSAEFPETAADDRMLVYFTSGTTGMPKAAVVSHRAMIFRMLVYALDRPLAREDSYVAWGPLFHMGSTDSTFATLLRGGKVIIVDGFDAAAIAGIVASEQLGMLHLNSAVIDRFLDHMKRNNLQPKGMKGVGVMADLVARQTIAELTALMNAPYGNTFGSTETGSVPASKGTIPIGVVPDRLSKVQSSFCELRLVNDSDQDVPNGERRERRWSVRPACSAAIGAQRM